MGLGWGLQDGQGPECLPCPQLISSKVPKAEYIPTIIRRDDPAIIPILYVSAPSSTSGLGGGTIPILYVSAPVSGLRGGALSPSSM